MPTEHWVEKAMPRFQVLLCQLGQCCAPGFVLARPSLAIQNAQMTARSPSAAVLQRAGAWWMHARPGCTKWSYGLVGAFASQTERSLEAPDAGGASVSCVQHHTKALTFAKCL
mmetsp:Transcript_121596/g.355363  ORF Transcript_121596/g.355363 Transcript_121596/m.355363 type:complete len:113 (-) Transcript_121596:496-834(-)